MGPFSPVLPWHCLARRPHASPYPCGGTEDIQTHWHPGRMRLLGESNQREKKAARAEPRALGTASVTPVEC